MKARDGIFAPVPASWAVPVLPKPDDGISVVDHARRDLDSRIRLPLLQHATLLASHNTSAIR